MNRESVLRSSGQYGPRIPVPDDADVQTRLIAFLGRDPYAGVAAGHQPGTGS